MFYVRKSFVFQLWFGHVVACIMCVNYIWWPPSPSLIHMFFFLHLFTSIHFESSWFFPSFEQFQMGYPSRLLVNAFDFFPGRTKIWFSIRCSFLFYINNMSNFLAWMRRHKWNYQPVDESDRVQKVYWKKITTQKWWWQNAFRHCITLNEINLFILIM